MDSKNAQAIIYRKGESRQSRWVSLEMLKGFEREPFILTLVEADIYISGHYYFFVIKMSLGLIVVGEDKHTAC